MGERESGFVEQALFEAPPGCLLESTGDGEHVIVVDHLGIGRAPLILQEDGIYAAKLDSPNQPKRVYWDGDAGPELDALVPLPPDGSLLRLSPDRRHVTYLAATQGRTRAHVGVDGSLGPGFTGIAEVPPTFSPTGGRIAYVAHVEGVFRLVVDHVPQLAFIAAPMPPLFDQSGDRIAFVAVSPTGGPPERVVVDDAAQREYDGIVAWRLGDQSEGEPRTLSSIAFDPDGRLGYVALQGSSMFVVLDGVEGPRFDEIDPQLVFSRDGRHVAYPARRGRQMTCIVDGVAQASYDGVGPPVFSPDGARLMYAADRGKRFAVVVDGTPEGEFSQAPMAYGFSPDGRHYAYITTAKRALRGERWCCVVDGAAGPEFDAIESRPVFSPHGDHLAYVARRGRKCFAVVDGAAGPPFEWAFFPSFSAAGRFAYLGGDSESVAVIVDGRVGPSFEQLASTPATPEPASGEYVEPMWFAFSPDGTHTAYTGMKRGFGARPVVDDVVGPAYAVATFPAVDDRRATFYGWRDGYVHRVTYGF
jgi:WD40-like Beta Propeller Repeat